MLSEWQICKLKKKQSDVNNAKEDVECVIVLPDLLNVSISISLFPPPPRLYRLRTVKVLGTKPRVR